MQTRVTTNHDHGQGVHPHRQEEITVLQVQGYNTEVLGVFRGHLIRFRTAAAPISLH